MYFTHRPAAFDLNPEVVSAPLKTHFTVTSSHPCLPLSAAALAGPTLPACTPGAADAPRTGTASLYPCHSERRALGRPGLRAGLPTAPYQAGVGDVGVIFRHGQVDGQSNTVGKDGEEDDDLKGSERKC